MKKIKIVLLATFLVLSLTSCKSEKSSEQAEETSEIVTTTTPVPIVAEEILLVPEDLFSDENTLLTDNGAFSLIPSIGVNTYEEDLSKVWINGHRVDIEGITLDKIIQRGSLAYSENAIASVTNKQFAFSGITFGIGDEKSVISIEAFDKDGNLSQSAEFDDKVKALWVSSDFGSEENEIEFCWGIKLGMEEKELVELLGEGREKAGAHIYNNGTNTLYVTIASKRDDNGKPIQIIDNIYLFNNFVLDEATVSELYDEEETEEKE